MYNPLIARLHNMHKGESCIVVGNGPSLKDVPLEFLNNNITLAANKIYMMKGFIFSYYVCVNPFVIEQSRNEYEKIYQPKFIKEGFGIPSMELHSMSIPMFSYDPSRYVYEGHTVTFVSLQLAFFMGFSKVGLVGVDHRYNFEGKPNEARYHEGEDPNHFDPNYFKDCLWHNPDLERAEQAYAMANEAFASAGRKVYNLTPNTALEVFEKMELSQWTS